MSNVVSFINQKGGVAKTTTAVNVAAAWAKQGKRVLLIDLDPQASATKSIFADQEIDYSVYDLMMTDVPPEQVIKHSESFGVDVLPSEILLSGLDIQIAAMIGREKVLRHKIASIKRRYDAIAIDCPPSLGLLTINALMASNDIVIPISPEYFSVQGIDLVLETLNNIRVGLGHRVNVRGIAITRYKSRTITNQIISEIEKRYDIKIFKEFIPDNIVVEEAHNVHLPLIRHAPESKASKSILALAREL